MRSPRSLPGVEAARRLAGRRAPRRIHAAGADPQSANERIPTRQCRLRKAIAAPQRTQRRARLELSLSQPSRERRAARLCAVVMQEP